MSKKALVIGLQRSGHAAIRLLRKQGYEITVTINKQLSAADRNLLKGVIVYDNGHPLTLLDSNWDLIVKNPGIPYRIPFIKEAMKRGYQIITEVELGYLYSNNDYYAITGTNGKTTTTTLIFEILRHYFDNVYCGGNIGLPLSDIVLEHSTNNKVVLELSSFQLMGIEKFRPHIATILNLAPDHLDYMDNVDDYYQSKMAIYKNQTATDYFLLNEDDKLILEYAQNIKAKLVKFSLTKESDAYLKNDWLYFYNEAVIDTKKIQIIGQHNLYNILVALCFAKLLNVSNECIQEVVYNFTGVEYRLEKVNGFKNNTYYNDSKSTTPDSTITALQAIKDELVLIIGGFDKKLNYSGLINYVNENNKVVMVLTYGQIKDNFSEINKDVLKFDNLELVVNYLRDKIDNQVVLFSPATSSFDQYDNYEQRGEHFNKLIKR